MSGREVHNGGRSKSPVGDRPTELRLGRTSVLPVLLEAAEPKLEAPSLLDRPVRAGWFGTRNFGSGVLSSASGTLVRPNSSFAKRTSTVRWRPWPALSTVCLARTSDYLSMVVLETWLVHMHTPRARGVPAQMAPLGLRSLLFKLARGLNPLRAPARSQDPPWLRPRWSWIGTAV